MVNEYEDEWWMVVIVPAGLAHGFEMWYNWLENSQLQEHAYKSF